VIISDDPERPYERPTAVEGLLLGSAERDSTFVHEADWYTKNDVDLRTGIRAEAIDKDAHEVVLAGGERVGYSRLLLATGARPRRLPVPGADLDGVSLPAHDSPTATASARC
jgi:3-phenylpropionate/trans-cinnamate dioxygenase ferredoxin reductase subunit